MKRIYTILTTVLIGTVLFAQSPQKMSYQAVIRNSSNALVTNTQVGMQISILQGSASGTVVYSETQTPTTNANGLVSIIIGGGVGFDAINWANDIYFIKTETDPTGGSTYTISGTTQLLSVPYALHAKTVASYPETDPVFIAHPANGITGTNIANWTTAFGWGNHASAGYLTSFTELDPVFVAHAASGVTSTLIGNWNTTYGWGDHSGLYRPIGYVPAWGEITDNPFSFVSPADNQLLKYNTASSKFENWTPDFLTSFTETDPKVGVNTTNYLSKWDGAALVSSTIFDNGKIGIGTNNPVENLHLKTTTTHGNIKLETSDGDGYYLGFNGGDYMAISVINGGTPYWETLNLKSGNVGIGTTNPSTKLDVNGIITSTGGNSTSWNTAFSKIAAVPTATLKGRVTAGTGLVEDLTAVQVRTLLNVEDGANYYTHPTGDGNLHVPVTGTTNSGKVLTAGATAGSLSWETPTTGGSSLAIGDSYGGGIVFYVYDNSQHGLIAATADQSTSMRWYASAYTNTMAYADGVGAGKANTAIIIANQGYGDGATYAARICNEYSVTVGGVTYGDWYLPSKFELNLLYLQKSVVGGFANNDYWSSTEYNTNTAWEQSFDDGYKANGGKSSAGYVRAVRAF